MTLRRTETRTSEILSCRHTKAESFPPKSTNFFLSACTLHFVLYTYEQISALLLRLSTFPHPILQPQPRFHAFAVP